MNEKRKQEIRERLVVLDYKLDKIQQRVNEMNRLNRVQPLKDLVK